jgi:CHAT domain-containing protein/Tfp pilus assembly protein PilF
MKKQIATVFLTIVICVSSTGVSGAADLQKGLEAHAKGDYETALREWKPLAEQGNAGAQYSLGMMHFGYGLTQNYREAGKWFRLAAEQGQTGAQGMLGMIYEFGHGVVEDHEEAVKWYRLAADKGVARAQERLGVMYEFGKGVTQDYTEAVKWYRLAAAQGSTEAQANLRAIYERGYGVTKEQIEEAVSAPIDYVSESTLLETTSRLMALREQLNEQDRRIDAEPINKRLLSIVQNVFGPVHLNVTDPLRELASLYYDQGRYAEAEQHYIRILSILEFSPSARGLDENITAIYLDNLGTLYSDLSRYSEAEGVYLRSLNIGEKVLGPDHPQVGQRLNNIGILYIKQGRYGEAKPIIERSLTIAETQGQDHASTASSLNSLAELYSGQGQYAKAEPLFKRSLSINKTVLGLDHPDTASTFGNLALLYHKQARFAEAELLYQRSMAINKTALGPDHLRTTMSINNLASLYISQGHYAKAEPLVKQSLENFENTLGPYHPYTSTSRSNLAFLHMSQGHYAEAEPLAYRSLAIAEQFLGPDHPDTTSSLGTLAILLDKQDRYAEALSYRRRSTSILRRRITAENVQKNTGHFGEQLGNRWNFRHHIDLALLPEQEGEYADLIAEAFDVMQLARSSAAGNAIARMAARFASGDDAIANVVREQQDRTALYERLDAKLVAAVGSPKRDDASIRSLRRQLPELEERIAELNEKIDTQFPAYASLTTREPLSLAETQKLLGPDEALLTFATNYDKDATHVFVVRQSSVFVYDADLGAEDLNASVNTLRAGLDLEKGFLVFDRSEAYRLYSELLAPAEDALLDVTHLFVVPEGALNSLPLGVLVTEPTGDAPANDNNGAVQTRGLKVVPKEQQNRIGRHADYLDTPWLARRYAMTTLPSIASLRALRTFAANTRATSPFIGFGDPVLDGGAGTNKGVQVASLFRGALADVDAVRGLEPLPDTADELRSMARYLKADDSAIYLRERATETMVKKDGLLKNNQVIAFSTHGLISGQLSGLSEPALVLTPPDEPTQGDDGLLTASEIALLSMNADWVILSACNTASDDGNGGQGLSGLARAFFYAGSRTLLVSHWPVASDATTALTSAMFEAANDNPDAGKAAALQSAMLSLADNDNRAHPALWAPFVIVGEGGANRR